MALMNTRQALRKATEATEPQALLDLYQHYRDNAPVVNAIVQNKFCPDEIKKQFVLYMIEDRLPRYQLPGGDEMLIAMRKSLEAWQPVQRLAPTPAIDPTDDETIAIRDTAYKKGSVILYGPPGTSKTFLARIIAKALTDGDEYRVEFVQFHASYSYEDFIEGIMPKPHGDSVLFSVEDKVFKAFCRRAEKQSSKRFVFIIDEINRADLSKVFGEIFTCLEYRGQPMHLLYSRKPFVIPSNLIVIGTMNTIDRSTVDLDFALRRRFHFFEVAPNEKRLEQVLTNHGKRSIDRDFLASLKDAFNKTQNLYPLGHAYFKDVTNSEDLKALWDHQLQPLLMQYFEFEPQKVRTVQRNFETIWTATIAEQEE